MIPKIISIYNLLYLIIIFSKSSYETNNTLRKNYIIKENYTSYFVNSTIRTLSERNFDIVINHNKSIDYLILFTFRRCPHCNKVITITENVEKNYSSKNKLLKFAKVDCYSNGWTAMRFDIFNVPIFIYIKNGLFASFKPRNYTEEELISFIESNDKEFKDYPPKIGYFGVFMKIFHFVNGRIKNNIPFWNEIFGWIVIFILLGSFLYFEYSIYKAACKKDYYQNNKDNSKSQHDAKGDKKKEKKENNKHNSHLKNIENDYKEYQNENNVNNKNENGKKLKKE